MLDSGANIERQIVFYQRKYELNPHSRAFAPLADLYRKAGRLEEAIEVLEAGLTEHPGYVSALVILARCHVDAGRPAESGEAFARVLELDPDNLVALKSLAEMALERHDDARGAALLERVVFLDPTDELAATRLEALRAAGGGDVPTGRSRGVGARARGRAGAGRRGGGGADTRAGGGRRNAHPARGRPARAGAAVLRHPHPGGDLPGPGLSREGADRAAGNPVAPSGAGGCRGEDRRDREPAARDHRRRAGRGARGRPAAARHGESPALRGVARAGGQAGRGILSAVIPVAILNGPNLDQLGQREPAIYGTTRWPELAESCRRWAAAAGLRAEVAQVDGEGELIARLHAAGQASAGIVLNAAAYTHTSVALRDCLLCLRVPVVEVHLTNPLRREPLRRTSFIADVVTATVQGFGPEGYRLAIEGLAALLRPPR